MSQTAKLGIIGGSGLYAMEALGTTETATLDTPFGSPSDAYVLGRLGTTDVAFLPRHGLGHRIMPTDLPFRANIHGFKQLGVDAILSISAVGSLREEIVPGDVVIPDQFIDRTRGRISTFFGGGVVAHVSLADPFCGPLSDAAVGAAESSGAKVHAGGTYICMEGPQFSTRAESHLYRSWGGDIIGMTNLQEAKLAREAEICFASLAWATDYDCWREDESDVDVAAVLEVLAANAEKAQVAVCSFADALDDQRGCSCRTALDHAVITDPSVIPTERREELKLILGRALSA